MVNSSSQRILFIGNSYTQRNDLPTLIAELAASVEPPCEIIHERVTVNGASLRLHWNAGKAAELIRSRPWDVVVLQEQSTLPVKNAKRYHENVRLFADVIREGGARIVLFLVWARMGAPESQAALNNAAQAIALEIGAEIARVGPAWERVLAAPNAPPLFEADGSHPTLAGSYLAACVLYRALLRRSPIGLPPVGALSLDPEQVQQLQQAAAGALES
jgi:hypothetical protein